MKTLQVIFLLALMAPIPGCQSETQSPWGDQTEIIWDTWGIPHIYAPDNESLYHAVGWSQMKAHGDLLLRLYGESRGRAAEYRGPKHLEMDRWIRTVGIPNRAADWFKEQTEPSRSFLLAFVRGINDFGELHPDQLSADAKAVLPVTPEDVLAHSQRVIHFSFVTNPRIVSFVQQSLGRSSEGNPQGGSNAWAIGPGRSETGHSMLLANPHLPWSDFYTWFEFQMISPDINLNGATLVGFPNITIGFNDKVGWTHTVNTYDGADLYELKLQDDGYAWDGTTAPFVEREETIKVLQEDGGLEEETLTVRSSVHGPVIANQGDRAIALRVAGLDQSGLVGQYWEMGRAQDISQLETAISRLQMPMFTVIAADQGGHILSLFGGRVPVRPAGPFDWSRIVPGATSETLWTETHVYGELPRVLDPEAAWVQNANDTPWTTVIPPLLNPDLFPPYMAPRWPMHFRAQRSAIMLMEDSSISFEEMVEDKLSTRMELADRILDELFDIFQTEDDPRFTDAVEVLKNWDRAANADSRGAVLFQEFWQQLSKLTQVTSVFETEWKEADPIRTPDGLKADAPVREAMTAAVERVIERYGSLDVAWGTAFRLRRGGLDLPANGAPGNLGVFRVVHFSDDSDGKSKADFGDSYVAAVEFSDPIRAKALLSYGNWSQEDSPHFVDQLPLFARKELRPVWTTKEEVEAHAESREVLPAGAKPQ